MKVRELIIRWGFEIDDKPLRQLERNIAGVKSIARITAISIGTISAGVGVLLAQAGKFEQWQIAFETMLGSTEKANKLLEDVKKFTLETPFQLPQVIEGTKRLLAFGIETEKLIPTLKALGDVSAGLGVDIGRMILNFGQVKSQAKLTGRELKDFAILGVPLLAELAKMLNKTEAEIDDMVSRREINFAKVEQAFINMTTEGGRFNNLMSRQMSSLFGIISNVKDMIIQIAIGLGQKLLPQAKLITKEFLNYLMVNKEIIQLKFYDVLRILIGYVDKVIKTIRILSYSLRAIMKLFGGLENSIKFVTYALLTLLAVRILSTFGSIIQVIGLMIVSFRKLGNAALIAQAKVVAVPILIGAAFVSLALILEDILAYFQGRNSITGILIRKFKEAHPYIQGLITLFASFIPILENINNLINKISSLFSSLKKIPKLLDFKEAHPYIQSLITLFASFIPILENINNLINKISSLFSGLKKIPKLLDFMDISTITEAISPTYLPEFITRPRELLEAGAGARIGAGQQNINNINLNNQIDVNVPPETSPELVGEKIKEGTNEAIQRFLRNTEDMIEDRGE